uniref:Uncharacterized protein n=1 Tax=Glossina austeni TaxID=7395 RepID=A0A1A9VMR5_GLOAU
MAIEILRPHYKHFLRAGLLNKYEKQLIMKLFKVISGVYIIDDYYEPMNKATMLNILLLYRDNENGDDIDYNDDCIAWHAIADAAITVSLFAIALYLSILYICHISATVDIDVYEDEDAFLC